MTNKEIVQQVNNAFSENNIEAFLDFCTDDIRWTMMGKPGIDGKDGLRKSMNNEEWDAPKLQIGFIISEGDIAACEGTMTMSKKDGTKTVAGSFCDVYQFQEGKITELRFYYIDAPADSVA